MTTTVEKSPRTSREAPPARRAGYVVAIAVNGVVLYIAAHLLEWGWLPWLTGDFELVLPILRVSLWATIVANLLYLAYDAEWFKLFTQLPLLAISFAVAYRTLDVFPFDFSAYRFDWELVGRIVLVVAMVGMAIAAIAVTVKLLLTGARTAARS